MAVPKHKITRSNRGKRRSQDRVASAQLAECQDTGRTHRRHHITDEGIYRGKVIVKS
jgi:large subunit ribosomal protein L32